MITPFLLVASNLFMTTAWYWHLRSHDRPLPIYILGFSTVYLKETPRWTDFVGGALILVGLAVSLFGKAL
jgi:uncharacterized protein (DUF486 family)